MKMYISLDEHKRIMVIGSTSNGQDIEIDIDENHEAMFNPFIYKYENGVLVKDTEFQEELIAEKEEATNQPSPDERFEGVEFLVASLMLDSETKDIIIEQQAEKLLEVEVTSANLLIELAMKGVI